MCWNCPLSHKLQNLFSLFPFNSWSSGTGVYTMISCYTFQKMQWHKGPVNYLWTGILHPQAKISKKIILHFSDVEVVVLNTDSFILFKLNFKHICKPLLECKFKALPPEMITGQNKKGWNVKGCTVKKVYFHIWKKYVKKFLSLFLSMIISDSCERKFFFCFDLHCHWE